MSLILMDAQETDKKEISNIVFQNKIDQLSNLEDTLTTWLNLQNQLKTLVSYYGEKTNQEAHPEGYQTFTEARQLFNQLVALGLFTKNMRNTCLTEMFQFALSELQETMKICWEPYKQEKMAEVVEKEK